MICPYGAATSQRAILVLLVLLALPLSAQAPYLVKDINTTYSTATKSSSPTEFTSFKGKVFFVATTDEAGTELWASDGTASGTHALIDINPGPPFSQPSAKTLYKNKLLFAADDGTNGREPWITDGTAAGTHMLKDLNPGSGSSNPYSFVTLGGNVISPPLAVSGRQTEPNQARSMWWRRPRRTT